MYPFRLIIRHCSPLNHPAFPAHQSTKDHLSVLWNSIHSDHPYNTDPGIVPSAPLSSSSVLFWRQQPILFYRIILSPVFSGCQSQEDPFLTDSSVTLGESQSNPLILFLEHTQYTTSFCTLLRYDHPQ